MDDALEIAWLREVYFTSESRRVIAAAFSAILAHIEARVNRPRCAGDGRGGDLW